MRHLANTCHVVMAALCYAASLPGASAAQIQSVMLPGNRPAIALSGVIVAGDDAKFHKLLATLADPVVVVTGPGGRVAPAIAIGAEVHNLGLTTLVPPNANCASACTFIWLGGARRLLGQGAKIGFHAMSLMQGNGGSSETHEADYALRSYLLDLGYALDTTATIVNTPSALVRWLDAGELDANGIQNEPYP